ncbi:hypothetical protein U1Q18_048899 [Sarracenia purpurea var. burkii]
MLLGTQLMELESAKYRQAGTNVVKEATQRRDGYVIIQIEPDDEVDFENEQPKELTSVSLQIEPDLENSGDLTSNSLPFMSHTPTDENVLVTNFLTITPSKQSDESELDCNNEEILSLICSTTESTCKIIHQTPTRFSFESFDRDLVTKSVSPTPNLTTDTSNFDSNVEFIKWTIPKTKFLKRHEYYKKAESLILCENRFKTLSIEEEYEDEGIEELSNVKSRDKIQDRLDVVKSKSRMIKFRSTSSVDRYSQLVQETRCRNFQIESVPDLFVNFLSKLDKMPVRVSENEVIEVIFNLLSPSLLEYLQLPFISVEIDCDNNNAALPVIRFDMEKVAGYLASDCCSHCLERVSELLGTTNHTRKLSELRKLSDRSILFGKSVQLAARVTWPMASVSELRESYNRVRKRTKRKADRLRVDDSTAMLSRNTVVPSQNWVGIERGRNTTTSDH